MEADVRCSECGAPDGEWCDGDCVSCERGECEIPVHRQARFTSVYKANLQALDWVIKNPAETLDLLRRIGYLGHGWIGASEDAWIMLPSDDERVVLSDSQGGALRTVYFVDTPD